MVTSTTTTGTLLLGMCSILALCLAARGLETQQRSVTTGTKFNKIIACYFFPSPNGLNESGIDPSLCTHILFASALVTPQGMKARDPKDITSWQRLVSLKKENPNLKIMVSLASGFQTVVGNITAIESFIAGTKKVLDQYNLDGVDLDWEFPTPKQKASYAQFIQAVAEPLHSDGKVLSLATTHDYKLFVATFDSAVINKYVDFVTVMTYDFYFYSPKTPRVKYNSPLLQIDIEILQLLGYSTVKPSKLLVGFPNYARSWKLANPKNSGYQALAVGKGNPSTPSFQWICQAASKGGVIVNDFQNGAEYMVYDGDWISFNGMYSAGIESIWAVRHNMGGFGFFSLGDSDHNNTCGYGPFPIINTIKRLLM